MADKTSVRVTARRYARALFEAARDQGALAQVSADVDRIGQLLSKKELAGWVADPRVDDAQKRALLAQELGAHGHVLTRGLVEVLGRRKRGSALMGLAAAFRELVDRHEGRVRGFVESARPLAEAGKSRLEQALSAATGKQVNLEVRVEPMLLGGVRVTLDGVRYDGSARGRLDQMRRRLAAAELAPR
ncbi:MAG: ATP synthase F1 subunit delta [Planctomycetota bacterium]|nr:MAG: ATP synthase F1 subunit delta [Planctomycetota bacterium]